MIIDGKQKGKQSSYRTEKENKNETQISTFNQ